MKRFYSLLLIPVFLISVFVFSPSASAAEVQNNYYQLELSEYEPGVYPNSSTSVSVLNFPSSLQTLASRVVIVGYFEYVSVDGFTLVHSSASGIQVWVKDYSFNSSLTSISFTNSLSVGTHALIYYAYLEVIAPSTTVSSGWYTDNVLDVGDNPSVLPSGLQSVSLPNYWTNFKFLQFVLDHEDISASTSVQLPVKLSPFSSSISYIPDLQIQVFSAGRPVDFTFSLDTLDAGNDGVFGYGMLSLNGPFTDDVIITFNIGDVFSSSDSFIIHLDSAICYYATLLSESQILQSINSLLSTNFSSINSLLGQINSGISTSNSWLSSIWTSISNGFSSVGNWFSTTWNNLISGFNSVVSSITTGAQDIVDALWELLGPAEPVDPPFSDAVGDLGALEDGILTDTDIGRQDFNNISGSAMSSIIGLSAAFYGASFLLSYFLELPFINTLLVLSLSLGLFAALTGIAMSFRSSSEARPSRSEQKQHHQHFVSGQKFLPGGKS